MSLNQYLTIKLFLCINLIYLGFCELEPTNYNENDVIWNEIKDDHEDGSGLETDLIPTNLENFISRNALQLSSMSLNSNQLREIHSLLNSNMDILKEEMNSLLNKSMEILKEEIMSSVQTEIQVNREKAFDVNEVKCSDNRFPESCSDVNECHNNIYSIMLPAFSDKPIPTVCDLKTLNGGWTIIQKRQDGSEIFFRNWTDYVEGFGNLDGEFFIGLEKLNILTSNGKPQELYIILEDFEGVQKYARYQKFEVEDESTEYKLNVGEYSGNAGDCLGYHNGMKFATRDRGVKMYCAQTFKGAWWYTDCHYCNLNGLYLSGKLPKSKSGQGISWSEFRGGDYSLKMVQMMIRPKEEDD